jgi:cytidyltransferase-like protein
MNLGEYLANLILEQDQKTIAIFPGAFKPPHKGHFEVVKLLSQQADEVVVLISPKSRDGISAEESFEIWNLYKPLLDENVSFKIASTNPVSETYDVIKNNPDTKFIVAFGKDEGDRFNQIKNTGKYVNASIFNAGSFEGLSATGLRNALKTDGDISQFIPEDIDVEVYKSILNVSKPLNESPPLEFEQDEYQDYILQNRDKIEKASAYFNLPIDDMEYAFNAGTPVVLMDDVWSKLQNTNSYNVGDLEQAIRYAHDKGLKVKPYIEAIKNGEELPLPLVLEYGQDKYHLVGGEVILALYRALKINPTVLKAILNLQINENKVQKKSQIAEFVKFAVNELGIQKIPTVKFSYDTNESQERGTFGYFDPNANHIWVYIKNRNTADILRTLAHELVHHKQGEDNRIEQGSGETGSEIENEANAQAGVLLRKFGKENKGIYENKTFFLDIPKFNQPKTFVDKLCESLHEITLSKDNAVEINGDLTGGEFIVDDITYEYSIKNIPNPYKDLGLFYNIQFTPKGEITSIPKGGKENYIKILSTMYKIIVDFIEKEKPEYVGISSLDNKGDKNYHRIYANLTDNKFNKIPGYFRKDVNLEFNTPEGKGRFVVLKKNKVMNEEKKNEYKEYVLNELFEKDLPNINKISNTEYIVGNGDDIEAKYYFKFEDFGNEHSVNWYFTDNNKNTSPEAWKQVTATSFKVLSDFIKNNNPKALHISGNTGSKTSIYKNYVEKLKNIFNNQYKIDNSDEYKVVLKSIEEISQSGIKKRMETLNESYKQALYYCQNGDINSKSKIERNKSTLNKIKREVLKELYNINENEKYKIYCDMDGVIVDFEDGYEKLTGKNIKGQHTKGDSNFWQPITDAGIKFWAGLKWMSDGKELWSYIKQYNPELLSAPSREESSKIGKHVWVKNNIPGTKLILKSASRKQELAAPDAILIDDRTDNIQQWKDAGGIGILHTSAKDTIKQLQELGL